MPKLKGLKKKMAEFFDLKNKPPSRSATSSPARPPRRPASRPRDIIVKIDGQPLERGDEPDESADDPQPQLAPHETRRNRHLHVMHDKGPAAARTSK